jgi:hypothetical protein
MRESGCQINRTHKPCDESYWVSRLRENLTSGSDGEGLETGHMVPRQSFTRQAGFKEIKQEIGSSKSQTRNADAVLNHLNFCMMATTLTWVYADRLQTAPDRKYKIRSRTGFGVCAYLHFLMSEEL